MEDSSENGTPSDTPELRRRIGATLAQRLWLRAHIGVLVGTTIVVGFIASCALQRYAPLQTALGLRYAISSVVAYAWFLLGVRWWVKYFAGIRPLMGHASEDRGRFELHALQKGESKDGGEKGTRFPDGCGDGCIDPSGCFDPEGILVVGAFLVVFWSIFWVYTSGPVILAEVATDTLFAGGLLRWARRTEAAWMSRSVRNTVIPFLIATTALVAFGLWAHDHCPTATRVGEVWECMR